MRKYTQRFACRARGSTFLAAVRSGEPSRQNTLEDSLKSRAQRLFALATVGAGLVAAAPESKGGLTISVNGNDNDAAYLAEGARLAQYGAGWVKARTNPNAEGRRQTRTISCWLFNRNGSGFIATAGHLLQTSSEEFFVEELSAGQGNAKTSPENVRKIVSWNTIPGFDISKVDDFTQPDLLIGKAETPFDGVPDLGSAPLSFGRAAEGEVVCMGSYGKHIVADPRNSTAVDKGQDGNIRGIRMPIENDRLLVSSNVSDYFYTATSYFDDTNTEQLGGMLSIYGSGSFVGSKTGKPFGIAVSYMGGMRDGIYTDYGVTGILEFAVPKVLSFMESETSTGSTPVPPEFELKIERAVQVERSGSNGQSNHPPPGIILKVDPYYTQGGRKTLIDSLENGINWNMIGYMSENGIFTYSSSQVAENPNMIFRARLSE